MGTDKALLPIAAPGGRLHRLIEVSATALVDAGASDVVVIGGDRAALGSAGLTVIEDRWTAEGPFGGIVTALEVAPPSCSWVVVLSCDLVSIDGDVVRELLGHGAEPPDGGGATPEVDVVVAEVAGRAQWTAAAWRRGAGPTLRRRFDDGIRAPRHAVPAERVRRIRPSRPDRFEDVDTPDDWARVGGRLPFSEALLEVDHTMPLSEDEVPEIDIDELEDRRRDGRPLIDVREPDEYEEARVAGGLLLPLGDIPERVDEVPADGPVYVICARGGRSRKAAAFLRANGIDAINVAGGTLAWIDAGKPYDSGAVS